MKNLKINKLAQNRLQEKEMQNVNGGQGGHRGIYDEVKGEWTIFCGCSCAYEGKPGGSSTEDNKNANYALGISSPGYSYY
jgi:natural product precursor